MTVSVADLLIALPAGNLPPSGQTASLAEHSQSAGGDFHRELGQVFRVHSAHGEAELQIQLAPHTTRPQASAELLADGAQQLVGSSADIITQLPPSIVDLSVNLPTLVDPSSLEGNGPVRLDLPLASFEPVAERQYEITRITDVANAERPTDDLLIARVQFGTTFHPQHLGIHGQRSHFGPAGRSGLGRTLLESARLVEPVGIDHATLSGSSTEGPAESATLPRGFATTANRDSDLFQHFPVAVAGAYGSQLDQVEQGEQTDQVDRPSEIQLILPFSAQTRATESENRKTVGRDASSDPVPAEPADGTHEADVELDEDVIAPVSAETSDDKTNTDDVLPQPAAKALESVTPVVVPDPDVEITRTETTVELPRPADPPGVITTTDVAPPTVVTTETDSAFSSSAPSEQTEVPVGEVAVGPVDESAQTTVTLADGTEIPIQVDLDVRPAAVPTTGDAVLPHSGSADEVKAVNSELVAVAQRDEPLLDATATNPLPDPELWRPAEPIQSVVGADTRQPSAAAVEHTDRILPPHRVRPANVSRPVIQTAEAPVVVGSTAQSPADAIRRIQDEPASDSAGRAAVPSEVPQPASTTRSNRTPLSQDHRRVVRPAVDASSVDTADVPDAAVPPTAGSAEPVSREVPVVLPFTGQVAGAVTRSLAREALPVDTVRELTIRLDPPELGALRIRMRATDEGMAVDVEAADEVTLEMLSRRVPELEQLLRIEKAGVHSLTVNRLSTDAQDQAMSRNGDNSSFQAGTQGDRRGENDSGSRRHSDQANRRHELAQQTLSRRPRVGIRA